MLNKSTLLQRVEHHCEFATFPVKESNRLIEVVLRYIDDHLRQTSPTLAFRLTTSISEHVRYGRIKQSGSWLAMHVPSMPLGCPSRLNCLGILGHDVAG